ncbi:sorting nexin-16 [Calliphora vicina]|uniref:sorting nexin-16 n=1 Tax=Calliphora vicina TaxID=7373 RepID=UPI00325A5E7E
MSLRAIKKRENQLPPPGVNSTNSRTTLFKKLTNKNNTKGALQHQQQQQQSTGGSCEAGDIGGGGFIQSTNCKQFNITANHIKQQYQLLGRLTKSNPEFGKPSETLKRLEAARLVRTKSEADVNKLLSSIHQTKQGALLNAKSEVCLKTISTHSYQAPVSNNNNNNNTLTQTFKTPRKSQKITQNTMLTGARSHRDLSQSAYASSQHNVEVSNCGQPAARRRMSEGNYMRSQRTNSMSTSEMTTSSNAASSSLGHCVPPVDPNSILRIPIIGYEVMEERARFTVYKLRVENPHTNDCWLVLRRYTDFVRLNTKLKQSFPHLILNLPRKKIFGDNFNAVFLDNRIQGLQMFVNSIMSKEELRQCQLVREFFCLDEPPSYSESMEECRAIFEAQEETIAHLKLQVNTKNDLILQLQQKLREEMQEKEQLKEMLKNLNINPTNGNI